MSKLEQRIAKRFEEEYRKALKQDFDLDKDKLIIFSDQHKGQADGADDFRQCKPAYHAALGYYYSAGYSLVLLGDVEELWEGRPRKVIKTYRDTLILEGKFAKGGSLFRIVGNHDDFWNENTVRRHLTRYTDGQAKVSEGLLLNVTSEQKHLGELFLLHGHQGTFFSDRHPRIGKFFIRHGFRHFQRITKIKLTTPARDFQRRMEHEMAMYPWAAKRSGLVLITGHTHRPVFESRVYLQRFLDEIAKKKSELAEPSTTDEARQSIQNEINDLSAELEWERAKSGSEFQLGGQEKPCYFNTGCCSYSDGDVTGIELEGGEIRLVRWPDDPGNPRKKLLRDANLSKILKQC